MKGRGKFAIGAAIIVVCLIVLAYTGFTQSKTYYHTISDLSGLQGPALQQRMRVSGDVKAGSIARVPGQIDFTLEEEGKTLVVSYVGRDPLPDTFKDGAQALVEGHLTSNGHFVAEQVQAKCASKYQATPPGTASSSSPATYTNKS